MVPSHEPIIEENIRNYFQTLHKQYDFSHREGINRYKFVAKTHTLACGMKATFYLINT